MGGAIWNLSHQTLELLAYIEQAKWDEFEEQTYVSLKGKFQKKEFHKRKCEKNAKAVKMFQSTQLKGKLLG